MDQRIAIGTDIGGQHITSAAIDLNKNEIIKNTIAEAKINNKASAEEILNIWASTLEKTISKIDINTLEGIGFAMPGPFDYYNGIAKFTKEVEKYENLYNYNIVNEIKKRLSLADHVKIRFINDATAFAIAESWIGKAKDHEKMIALTLGTGFGSAYIDNGIPVLEGERVAKSGCLWHVSFNGGIADDSFSTRWFINNYAVKTGKSLSGVKEIAELALQNDEIAKELFEKYGSNMGEFLSPWIKKFDAQSIVIGGNIIGAFELFGKFLNQKLEDNHINTNIFLSELMENAAIVGASRIIEDKYYESIKNLLSKM